MVGIETNQNFANTTRTHPLPTPKVITNPVGNNLKIYIPEGSARSTSKIEIYNTLGVSIIQKEILSTGTELAIPVEHLASGIYFVKLAEYPQHTLKFIKR